MKKIFALLVLMMVFTVSYGQTDNNLDRGKTDDSESVNEEVVAKIYIDKKGKIFLNGEKTDLTRLDEALNELSEKNGTVYYSRSQKYDGDIWIRVMDLVTEQELPISFFMDREFKRRVKL